ncbi:hypothetical protein HHI36_022009 [Cryptolaemus montrouzieri]|uniref:Uncharacterized protein n=1 Tax=Cryptolaemus montrouzieri TaxID=559131 RepID=A0ABD2MYX0_9CUCU
MYVEIRQNKRRIYDEENPEQSHPVTKKIKEKESRPELPVNNRYSQLSREEITIPMEEQSEEEEEDEDLLGEISKIKKKRTSKPPPLVLHGKMSDLKKLVEKLKEIAPRGFHIKYHKNTSSILVKNESDWV